MSKKKTKKTTIKNRPRSGVGIKNWWQNGLGERKPIIKFWLAFAGIMLLFYILAIQPFFVKNIQEPVGVVFAHISSGLLGLLGQGTIANGMAITSEDYSLFIQKGCDAIAPIMLVVTGILLFPSNQKKKWIGIGIGILSLFALNLIRIVTLYFVGVHAPTYFEFMHIEFWQVVFIGLAILYFFYWLNWATKAEAVISKLARN